MNLEGPGPIAATPPLRHSAAVSRLMLILAWLLLGAAFFLISPPPGKTYPGAIPWRAGSVLRRVTEWMSLNGWLASVRGVEVKDLALHLAAAVGLVLVGVSAVGLRSAPSHRRLGAAGAAQVLLAGWVLLSLASSLWAGDGAMARSQALVYGLNLAWAVSVAALLRQRHVPGLLYGLVGVSAGGALLCIWYYYERNPFHRPGFPIGNPSPLAIAIVPAVLVSGALLADTIAESWRAGRPRVRWAAIGGGAALVPLGWCLYLTQARGALVGLCAGLATMVLFRVGRRLRWILAASCAVMLLAAGIWWLSTSQLDVAMARGATTRFRLYAWRYAAELWSETSWTRVGGQGAGAYPRLAGALAVRDRALDPAAFFSADIVEHAHNELLEVLTEIGLVGGVTYVGGFVATFFAAAAMLARQPRGRERWLLLALIGGVAAVLVDALTGVALRLPGVPAIAFTLLGALWAACQRAPDATAADRPPAQARWEPASAVVLGLVCVAAAIAAGWLALRNWSGVRLEQEGHAAYAQGRYETALPDILLAETRLLDPVRVLVARDTALECRYALAQKASLACVTQTTTAPRAADWDQAIRLAHKAYEEAVELSVTAPGLINTDKIAARSAGWLAELYRRLAPEWAVRWSAEAGRAYLRQRGRTPFDVDTLLGLIRYTWSAEDRIGLLRDALRSLDTLPFEEEGRRPAHRFWLGVLTWLAQEPGFEPTLSRYVNEAAPITPETDVDAIVASRAPETYRLAAAWNALCGDYQAAIEQSARAATLYSPVRVRFPNLQSTALAEQADYVLRDSPSDPTRAAVLLRQALAALPVIQTQQYEDLATPFRRQLSFCLLASGQIEQALDVLGLTLGEAAGDPQALEQALDRLLQAAIAAGIAPDQVADVRGKLCARFPRLCAGAPSSGRSA